MKINDKRLKDIEKEIKRQFLLNRKRLKDESIKNCKRKHC